jgi:hypothetical protein
MTLGRFAGQVPGQQMPAGARLVYLSVLSVLPDPVLVLPIASASIQRGGILCQLC